MKAIGDLGRGAMLASCAAASSLAPLSLAHAQATNPVTLEGADAATLAAIALTLPQREKPESLFDAERLSEEAAARAEAWMRSEGYYAGTAQAVAEDEPPRAGLKITLNQRFTFAPPILVYSTAPPDEAAARAAQNALAPVTETEPARAAAVLAAEAAAVNALQSQGYAEAKAETRQAIVDHATGQMNVTFHLAAGAPVRLGEARLDPPGPVKSSYLEQLKTWRTGDRYTPEALTNLRRDLSSTGAFARVTTALAEPNGEGWRDVLVHLEPAKKHALELGAQYSTSEGAGINAQWTRRNAFGRADQLTFSTVLAEKEQTLGASLWRPHAIRAGRHLRYTLETTHEDTAAYDRIGAAATIAAEADINVRRALIYGASLAADDYRRSSGVASAVIASVYGGLRLDYSDSRFDPREGSILEARAEPTVTTGAATTTFVKFTSSAKGYYSPSTRVTLAARVDAGWIQTIAGQAENLPLDRLFYAGGGGSVRGYEYKSIYPGATTVSDPPGGKGLVETSLEARFRVKGPFGAALFVDGGSAFNDFEDVGAMRWGAGFGVRYDLGFAPVRLDIATPLNRRPGDPKVAIYASLGQAF
jgi:translocation and assembly module TamA